MPVSRRVSYILPAPVETPQVLSLPGLGERRRGVTSPYLVPRTTINPGSQSGNAASTGANGHADGTNGTTAGSNADPFASPPPEKTSHPRHCLGVNSLALDTSTVLSGANAPGGILYSGGRDGLVVAWELNVPHRRRRGGRYEHLPGRGGARVKWERIGDGAEIWDEDDDEDDDELGPNGGNGNGNGNRSGNGGHDEEDEGWSSEEELNGEGWVGVDGERVAEGIRKRRAGRGEVPYEDRWELDYDSLRNSKPPVTNYRQSAQTHTDWVNSMLLCNLNQTIITGSSDRTIRAWSPHTPNSSPALIGRHRDYVRTLAWAKYPSLLFSGALDRHISVWDVYQPNPEAPLLNLDLEKADDWGGMNNEGGERGSVYALGTDPAGKVLAAGTPEQVVRLWDPRVGDQSIGKLIGHSDCVKSIVVSDDGRYMLTGSSDTTIKLWSLGEHRCLHTFNHHTSSVWSLYSNHPNLERFYSGSRDGHLCVVDVESVTDISDGECVVLAREGNPEHPLTGETESKAGDEGIRSIAAMDDTFVWTATGSAEVKRWKDVGRRVNRMSNVDDNDDGLSYAIPQDRGEVSLAVPEGPSAPILDSVDGASQPLLRSESRDSRSVAFAPPPVPRAGAGTGAISQLRNAHMSGTSLNSSAPGDEPGQDSSLNGIPYDSLVCLGLPDSPYSLGFSHEHRSGDFDGLAGAVPISSVPQGINELRVPGDGVDGAGGITSHRGSIQVDREQNKAQLARSEFEDREVAAEAKPLRSTPDDVISGRPGLVRSIMLNDRQHVLSIDTEGEVAVWNILSGACVGRFEAADVAAALELERGVKPETAVRKHSIEILELVKDRIEGETMVITWCQVDTKIGSLVVHLEEGRVFDAEVYADELGLQARDDVRLNLGKWALANLFKGLVKAEEMSVVSMSPATTTSSLPSESRSPQARPIPIDRPPAAPSHRQRAMTGSFSGGTPSLDIPGLATSAETPAIIPELEMSRSAPTPGSAGWQAFGGSRGGPLSAIPQSPTSAAPQSPLDTTARGDYFSLRKKEQPPTGADEKVPPNPAVPSASVHTPAVPLPTPGGSKKMFKGFGKKKKSDTPMSPVVEIKEPVVEEEPKPKMSERESEQMTILDTVRAHSFHPPSTTEAPPIDFPSSTALLISEEAKDAGAWVVTYRSQVSSTERDMEALEMNSPLWLLDYLFTSRTRVKDPVKLTFILEPVPGSGIKEMPEGTTRLSASRILRARKIVSFIYDKLDLGSARRTSIGGLKLPSLGSKRSSQPQAGANQQATIVDGGAAQQGEDVSLAPEETLELLCGDHVVNPKMTLATLKQYYGSGGDMLLYYRMKGQAAEGQAATATAPAVAATA